MKCPKGKCLNRLSKGLAKCDPKYDYYYPEDASNCILEPGKEFLTPEEARVLKVLRKDGVRSYSIASDILKIPYEKVIEIHNRIRCKDYYLVD
jgi:hypothetical protein